MERREFDKSPSQDLREVPRSADQGDQSTQTEKFEDKADQDDEVARIETLENRAKDALKGTNGTDNDLSNTSGPNPESPPNDPKIQSLSILSSADSLSNRRQRDDLGDDQQEVRHVNFDLNNLSSNFVSRNPHEEQPAANETLDNSSPTEASRRSRLWRMSSGMSALSSRGLSTRQLNLKSHKAGAGNNPDETKDAIAEEKDVEENEAEEETAEELAERKMQQRLRQAKKLEQFFVKTNLPPKPLLERTKYDGKNWSFDPNKDWLGRSSNSNFFTLKKPFFSSFHLAWISFFMCFMGWFAVGPLIPLLLKTGFTKEAIEVSNALALASTIIIRFILGPLCEVYGARLVMTWILFLGGIMVCLTSTVTTGQGLMAARFFIGLIGGAFVPCQFWITMMFSTKIVGVMSGSAAGFGNSGAGVIVFLMGGLIAGFQSGGYSDDLTWRYSLLIPGFLMVLCAGPTYFLPSDCPQGKWKDRKYGTPADKVGRMAWLHRGGSNRMREVLRLEQKLNRAKFPLLRGFYWVRLFFMTEERFMAFWDWRAWMVGIQYAVASGVELSILTGLTAFYTFEFGCNGNADAQWNARQAYLNNTKNITDTCLALDASSAAYVAAIFGLTNVYGRTVGGWFSDFLAGTKGIFKGTRGRHLAIFITLLLQGILMLIWSGFNDWRASAGFLVLFSSIVHCAKGAVIAIAPFVSPGCVGPVMGVVSAVGNIGGVLMALMYSAFRTSRETYYWQGVLCIVGSLTAFMLKVHDLEQNRLVWLLSRPAIKPEFEELDSETDQQPSRNRRLSMNPGSTVRYLWEQTRGGENASDRPIEQIINDHGQNGTKGVAPVGVETFENALGNIRENDNKPLLSLPGDSFPIEDERTRVSTVRPESQTGKSPANDLTVV